MPRIPLVQPYLSLAMQKGISGYAYWFHRQLDYRTLSSSQVMAFRFWDEAERIRQPGIQTLVVCR
jgi:hypothetical protein